MKYAVYMNMGEDDKILYDIQDAFCRAQEFTCPYGCYRMFPSPNKTLSALANNIAGILQSIAGTKDELNPAQYWYCCGGVCQAMRVLRITIGNLARKRPEVARGIYATIWRKAGPELTKRMRDVRARAIVRLAPFLQRRLVQRVLARRELARIMDGKVRGNDLLLRLLRAPILPATERRDIDDAARAVYEFLAVVV